MSQVTLEDIVSLCKRRGFIYQGSDVYGGLAGTWDYGPLGVLLKRNITNLWWQYFVEAVEEMFGVDTAILMNQKVWQASGHTETFTDPLVECSNCHGRFRADKIDTSRCPTCGKKDTFGAARQFNMMFATYVGPVQDASSITYLRPETAQGMFTNYKNVIDSVYPDVPFGIAQQGKAFRNEISPRDFIFRDRELEQMEIEYFVHPDQWQPAFDLWRQRMHDWCKLIGLPASRIHEREVPASERAHYSQQTIDFEYDFPIGREELYGLAYRGDFDLTNIQRASGKNMEYRPKDGSQAYIPHVVEPTFGVERTIMAVLTAAYTTDEVEGSKRIVLKLPAYLAPIKVAVSPLLKNKTDLVQKSRNVYAQLKSTYGNVLFDDNGNIGKRYRRQDEIGTPYCVTIDFQSLTDDTATIRDRDTAKQERVAITELASRLGNLTHPHRK